jgi:Xaa-Pro aminopeptidase
MNVVIKTPEQIEQMREAGKLAAEVLEMIGEYVKPGVTTEELDPEDVSIHLRVPVTGLVTEVHARFQHIAHSYARHC